MATPQAPVSGAPAKSGPIDQRDVDGWKSRLNEHLARTDKFTAPAATDSRKWHASFFGCFNPIDTCLITWCLPCVTFGKTHHRAFKSGSLEGYEPVNTSCLLLAGTGCVGLHWIPMLMQRADIREKYHLQGTCITDLAATCCCALCSLVQQDKEAAFREEELSKGVGATEQYQSGETMDYKPKA